MMVGVDGSTGALAFELVTTTKHADSTVAVVWGAHT